MNEEVLIDETLKRPYSLSIEIMDAKQPEGILNTHQVTARQEK